MTEAEGPEAAARRVLPALNFEPRSLGGLTSFFSRAQRRVGPSVLALEGIESLLVFVGTVETAAEDFAAEAGERGLAALTEATRAACRQLIVAWEDRTRHGAAAAFVLDKAGNPGSPLGTSWLAPESWPTPMVDAEVPPRQRIDAALAGVRALIAASPRTPDFGERLRRALDLLDMAIRTLGGEGQHIVEARGVIEEATDWDNWLDDLERSIRDEERRVAGGEPEGRIGVAGPIAAGPLAGLRVFLSYARPDSATLARPVNRALQEAGAQVWFDQEEPLEKTWLDEGLAARIADCDAFLMCASDEYVERAGYATQELAWALAHLEGRGRLRRFAVAARPETILPSLVISWPLVVVDAAGPATLVNRLAAALAIEGGAGPAFPAAHTSTVPPPLQSVADLDATRRRRRHVRRFLEITLEDVLAIAEGKTDRRVAETKRRLMALGEELDWDGTLAGIASWPADPLVRSCRWDLACLRALASSRWPLSGDLSRPDGIAHDVERILTQPSPILDWPTACGWADNERRFGVRRQAGLLRVFGEMLARGLDCGLTAEGVNRPTLDAWARAVADRRREAVDALIDMRLAGALSWQGDPPSWDALYRSLARFLTSLRDIRWDPAVPQEALLMLGANAEDVAAVAADVTWTVALRTQPAQQHFVARNWTRPLKIEIWTALGMGEAPDFVADGVTSLTFGLGIRPDGDFAAILGWRGLDLAVSGAAWARAPTTLCQQLRPQASEAPRPSKGSG